MAEAASSKKATAAKAEKNGTGKTITLHGREWKLPAALPFAALPFLKSQDEMSGPDIVGILTAILGDDQLAEVWKLGLSIEEGNEFTDKLLSELGMSVGESPASSKS